MTPAEKPTMRTADNRRCNKPIMEKRRRARINSCLNDLKALILEALKKDPSRHSKLEKADILEMTVKHLQNLHRQQVALAAVTNPGLSNKFRAGYDECATEVQRYLGQMEGLDPCVRQRLVGHLTHCAKSLQGSSMHAAGSTRGSAFTSSPLLLQDARLNQSIINGLHLVPTRLPNGDLAFLLPGSYALETGTHSMDTGNAICLVKSATGEDGNSDAGVTPVLPHQLINVSPTLQKNGMTTISGSTSAVSCCAFVSPNSRVPMKNDSTSINTVHIPVTSEANVTSGCLRPRTIVSNDVCDVFSDSDKEPWRPW